MDPNRLSDLFGPGIPAQSVNLSPMTLQQMAEAGYLPISAYNPANLPAVLFSNLVAASDPANRVVVITGSAPAGLLPLGIASIPVENGSLYLRLSVATDGTLENLTSSLSGTLRIGAGLPVELTLPRSLYDWQLNSQDGATVALGSGLAELTTLIGSPVASLLPGALPTLPGISLTRLAIQFNTQSAAISLIALSLTTTTEWEIISNALSIKQTTVELTYQGSGSGMTITGQITGLLTLLGVDISLTIPIPPGANWVLQSFPYISIPSIGTLVSQASNLVGTGDLTSVLFPGLETPDGFTLTFLEIVFNPIQPSLLNVALTLRSDSEMDWTLPYASSLALSNLMIDLSLANPTNSAMRAVTGTVSGVITLSSVFVPIRIHRLGGESSWTLDVTYDEIAIGLSDLVQLVGINENDFRNALPGSLSIVSDLTLSQLSVVYDLTANLLRDISFVVTLNDPWEIITGYLTVNSLCTSMQIYGVTTLTRGVFVGMSCEMLLTNVSFILGAQNNSGTSSGWVCAATMAEGDSINLTDVINSLLNTLLPGDFRLPSSVPTVICTGAQLQITPATQAFSLVLTSTVTWPIAFAQARFEIDNLRTILNIGSPGQNTRPYTASIEGQFSFLGINGTAMFVTSNTSDDTIIGVTISNSQTAIKLPSIAHELTSGSQTGSETWNSLLPAVPADFTDLGTLTLALAVNLTRQTFLLCGSSSKYSSVAFLTKQLADQTWGYFVAVSLAEGFRFGSLLPALSIIDGILTVTKASFSIASFAAPSLQELLADLPTQATGDIPSPRAAMTETIQLATNPDVATVQPGVNFYAQLQFADGLLARVAQLLGITGSPSFTLAGFISSVTSETRFSARLGDLTLLNQLAFNTVVLTYQAARDATFTLSGEIAIKLHEDLYTFSGDIQVSNDGASFTLKVANPTSIANPLGIPNLTLSNLGFAFSCKFANGATTDILTTFTGEVTFANTLTLAGFVGVKDGTPALVLIELMSPAGQPASLNISTLFQQATGQNWPPVLDVALSSGLLWYADTNPVIYGGQSYAAGFHAHADVQILFLPRIALDVAIYSTTTSTEQQGLTATAQFSNPIDWGFIKLTGTKGSGSSEKGPWVSIDTRQTNLPFSLGSGLTLLEAGLGDMNIFVGSQALTGSLTLPDAAGLFAGSSLAFAWDDKQGFRVTSWPLGTIKLPDFDLDLENIKVNPNCPVSGIIKLPVTSKINLDTPSFSITLVNSGGAPTPTLTLSLTGSFDLVVNSSAYQDALLSVPIINATLAVPFSGEFTWADLAEMFITCIKGAVGSIFTNLITKPANLAKLLAVEGIEWAAPQVLAFLVCEGATDAEAAAFVDGATEALPVTLSILGASVVVGGVAGSKDAKGNWHMNTINNQQGPLPDPTLTANLWPDAGGWNSKQYYSTIRCADVDGDGRDEVLARSSGEIQIARWDQSVSQWSIWPMGPGLSDAGGWDQVQYYSTIRCADVDGDGQAELLARGAGGIVVWHCDRQTLQWIQWPAGPGLSDAGGWDKPQYYQTIQCADIDGDGQAEVLARGAVGIVVWHCDRQTLQWTQMPAGPDLSDAGGWENVQYYSTIQCADIDGDGRAELLARGAGGIVVWQLNKLISQWGHLPPGPGLSDAGGWDKPQYYQTIQCADIDGDGQAELIARGAVGLIAWHCDSVSRQWTQLPGGPGLSDAGGWENVQYYSTIQCADIDGDGQAEVLARGAAGIVLFKYDATRQLWIELSGGPGWSDAGGWGSAEYYSTIHSADIDGYGQAELIARSAGGMTISQPLSTYVNTWQAVFQRAVADPLYKTLLFADPLTGLKQAGIAPDGLTLPEKKAAIELVRLLLMDAPSPDALEKQKVAARKNASSISAQVRWLGLVIHLSQQAITDANNGVDLRMALAAAVALALDTNAVASASATSCPDLSTIVNTVSAYLRRLVGQMNSLNQSQGVDLLLPWISFASLPPLATAGIVILPPASSSPG